MCTFYKKIKIIIYYEKKRKVSNQIACPCFLVAEQPASDGGVSFLHHLLGGSCGMEISRGRNDVAVYGY